jgi:hypothetical protein
MFSILNIERIVFISVDGCQRRSSPCPQMRDDRSFRSCERKEDRVARRVFNAGIWPAESCLLQKEWEAMPNGNAFRDERLPLRNVPVALIERQAVCIRHS